MPLVCLEMKAERKSRNPGKRKSSQRELLPEVLCRDEKYVKTSTLSTKTRLHSSLQCLCLWCRFLNQMYTLKYFLCFQNLKVEGYTRSIWLWTSMQKALGRIRLKICLVSCNDVRSLFMGHSFCLVLGNCYMYLSDRKFCFEFKVWPPAVLYCVSLFCFKVDRKWHEKNITPVTGIIMEWH